MREEIEKTYKESTVDKDRQQLAKDLVAADKRAKELDFTGTTRNLQKKP